jgi:hypothetical protein
MDFMHSDFDEREEEIIFAEIALAVQKSKMIKLQKGRKSAK